MARAESVHEVFENMSRAFIPEQAEGLNAVIQFELSGEGGGDWQVGIADGQVNATAGSADYPNVTISATAEDYLAMVNGDLDPMKAFMGGKIRVKGDVNLVLKMQSMFKRAAEL